MKPNYVNMADIKFREPSKAGENPAGKPAGPAGAPVWDIIELLFFAYRDFVGDPDHVLEQFGFGRAHHRVVHFVYRYPGLKVADLLDVLRITKQSLGRVLKQLIDEGYVLQKAGSTDRRQRLLYATAKGEELVSHLAGLQTARIERALRGIPPEGRTAVMTFLRGMIEGGDPDPVLRIILDASDSASDAAGERKR